MLFCHHRSQSTLLLDCKTTLLLTRPDATEFEHRQKHHFVKKSCKIEEVHRLVISEPRNSLTDSVSDRSVGWMDS